MNRIFHYSTIIFDLDGTLIDTWPGLLATLEATLPAQHLKLDKASLRLTMSQGVVEVFRHALLQSGVGKSALAGLEAQMNQSYLNEGLNKAEPYPGVLHLLNQLRSQNCVLGICTNRDRDSTQMLLSRLGWSDVFTDIQCLDDGAPPKPAPQGLKSLVERLGGSPSETLFVGDSVIDSTCAQAAGIDFAAHKKGYHAQLEEISPNVVAFDLYDELTLWATQRMIEPTEHPHA